MQIIGSGQIVTLVTSVVPTFLSCIALFDLLVLLGFTVTFALFARMCFGEFRLCGGDHGLCPLDSHKPLIKAKPVFAAAQTFLRKASRLDRNFYMGALLLLFGLSGFMQRCRRGCFVSVLTKFGRVPPKKNKNSTARNLTVPHDAAVSFTLFIS